MSEVTPITGAVWGIFGAIAMVVVMQAIGDDSPPPFAVFWSRFVGDGDPGEAMPQALVLHGVYAVGAGAVYALLFNRIGVGPAITSYAGGVVWGLVWGIVLLVGAAVFWVNLVLDMDPDRSQVMTMGVAHLAFGLVLGLLGATVPHLA